MEKLSGLVGHVNLIAVHFLSSPAKPEEQELPSIPSNVGSYQQLKGNSGHIHQHLHIIPPFQNVKNWKYDLSILVCVKFSKLISYILKVGISGIRDSANSFHFLPKFRLRTRKPSRLHCSNASPSITVSSGGNKPMCVFYQTCVEITQHLSVWVFHTCLVISTHMCN